MSIYIELSILNPKLVGTQLRNPKPKLVGFGNGQSGWDIDTMILFKFLSKFVSNKSLVSSANWLFLGGGAQTTI
jgi:hypothetical protein